MLEIFFIRLVPGVVWISTTDMPSEKCDKRSLRRFARKQLELLPNTRQKLLIVPFIVSLTVTRNELVY